MFAIRFANPVNANKFKKAFDDAVIDVIENEAVQIAVQEEGDTADGASKKTETKEDGEKAVADDLEKLNLQKE